MFRVRFATLILFSALSVFMARAEGFVTLDGILSSRKTYEVTQDADGFIWICTKNGIDRFDGHAVKTYQIKDLPQSRDQILSFTRLVCDNSGILWMMVKNGKLYRYDKDSDEFYLVIDIRETHPDILLYSLCFLSDGGMALGTSQGVLFISENGDESGFLSERIVKSVVEIGNNAFWLGTDNGLFVLENGTVREIADSVDVSCMLLEEGILYVGTFSDSMKSVGKDGVLKNFGTVSIQSPVVSILRDCDGYIVVGTDGDGLFYYDPVTGNVLEHCVSDDLDKSSISGNTISDLCLDRSGNLWVATTTDWVSRQCKGTPEVEVLVHHPGNPNSLISNHVNVVFEDRTGNIWFGTNDGVCSYDQDSRKWKTYSMPYPGVVLALAQDCNGDIWVGGYGFPLSRIDYRNNTVKLCPVSGFEHTYALFADGSYMWIGGIDSPLARYNISDGKLTGFPVNNVGDILKAEDGKLTVATSGGLFLLDPGTGSLSKYDSFGSKSLAFPVRCLDNQGSKVWMATDGDGLISYDRVSGEGRFYSKDSGLSSDSVNGIVVDSDDNVWCATFDNLYRLDADSGVLVDMNGFVGVSRGGFNPAAVCLLSDGRLALGTADGAILFNPSDFSMGELSPVSPIISEFKLWDNSKPINCPDAVNADLIDKLELKAGQNSFSIAYSALDFSAGYRIAFSSQLVGFDRMPRVSDGAGSIDYYNVPSGRYDYTLKVIDKYSGAVLGERHLPILINRPLWLSWWALVIYAALFGTFAGMIVVWYRRRAYNRVMTEKINTFVNFAHDLKTPITLIKTPLNELENMADLEDKVRTSVMTANRNSDRLLSMINKLLDIRKNDSGWGVLKLSSYDSGDYLDNVLADFSSAARQKGLDFSYHIEPDLGDIMIDKEKMDLIINNILSNSVKYTSEGFIHVLAKNEKRSWVLEISDSGIGIPYDFQSRIFRGSYRADNARECDETGCGIGLMITRQLVEQHHGKISFTSEEGYGTTFRLSFPMKYKVSESVMIMEKSDPVNDIPADTVEQVSDKQENSILVVEDDAETLEYMRYALSEHYTIYVATDGQAALDIVSENNPDIVISDVSMPVMNGYELCRRIKSDVVTSHIPVILLTGLTDRNSVIRGLESGADDYVVKPFDMSVLKARIKNILSERQRLREAILYSNKSAARSEYTNKLDQEFMDKVLTVVQNELSNSEFQINDLCRELAMSRTAFYNKLKSLTGQGPNDFIRIYRLERAKEYLEEHRYSIAEVSDMVGFSDAKYFSVCFKKRFGVSPSRF